MDSSTSLFVLFFGLNQLREGNTILDKQKKILYHCLSILNPKG